jgi:hypothetical protein
MKFAPYNRVQTFLNKLIELREHLELHPGTENTLVALDEAEAMLQDALQQDANAELLAARASEED